MIENNLAIVEEMIDEIIVVARVVAVAVASASINLNEYTYIYMRYPQTN